MTTTSPVTHLQRGGGATTEKACVMNAVHAVMQLRQIGDITRSLNDAPPCTDEILRIFAICVNDAVDDEVRQRMQELVEDLYLAHPIKNKERALAWDRAFIDWLVRRKEEGRVFSDSENMYEYSLREAIDSRDGAYAHDAAIQAVEGAVDSAADDDARVDLLRDLLQFYDKFRADEGLLTDEYEYDPEWDVSLDDWIDWQAAQTEYEAEFDRCNKLGIAVPSAVSNKFEDARAKYRELHAESRRLRREAGQTH